MKTRAGGLIAAVLIAVAGVFILQKATGGLVPLADDFIQGQGKPEAYYLKAEDHAEKLNNGKYNYTLTGYDASGHKQQIEAEADEKLRPCAFIKVWAYGTKAGSLTEIHEEEIPEGALAAMKTN
ncbi:MULTISPECIES: YxeA family protein [Bacillus]|uniref:YxeA family protein n=1 Tax=Bacillus TaxID=1386 RepID=UPI0022441F2B|nr:MULTISPECIES: YxeA family protein [Bacillus]MDN5386982.1 YxeA family protein [Bacillus sp. LB7]MEC1020982.1 YxeA family protein [Bacillus paralicheniformis]MEC1027621.1 YxeA family protein [Bacillus paralicheniformis]MEC1051154.1 YxeA family protein [Bacillus paralicheniformis]MEC1062444.1 YxeA family protein [Bacillus paralicheniformis]